MGNDQFSHPLSQLYTFTRSSEARVSYGNAESRPHLGLRLTDWWRTKLAYLRAANRGADSRGYHIESAGRMGEFPRHAEMCMLLHVTPRMEGEEVVEID